MNLAFSLYKLEKFEIYIINNIYRISEINEIIKTSFRLWFKKSKKIKIKMSCLILN